MSWRPPPKANNNECEIGNITKYNSYYVNLTASGCGCDAGGAIRSGGTQAIGRRLRQSSAFNWPVRPFAYLSSSCLKRMNKKSFAASAKSSFL
ncbi:hypothetical protein KIN20_021351 [Parelaphostrongylus tenuis]|uniref:Uncharacterized protein n=1 Tax=Parelaphostrongylus tenuis TaxID=148309 RepID=A0AAD5MSN3_PARTN|nr:hypothetical protein KIN20_021351 [Parelaphostrongylus tenuis]